MLKLLLRNRLWVLPAVLVSVLGLAWEGLVQKAFAQSPLKVTPYGRVELDVVYSTRDTNPLDPANFNGYLTAAGSNDNDSSTFNPRFSVIGLYAEKASGIHALDARVEFDFYGTNDANLIHPRLRLAYIDYTRKKTRLTVGMDWTPVAALHPDVLDFSIMGYGGNLWQRIPQITVRQKFGEQWEGLLTVMRFERGGTLTPPQGQPFSDRIKMPYVGTRVAYHGWGGSPSTLLALSGAYRQYNANITDKTVRSYLAALEWVLPLGPIQWSGEVARGQALGDEFFRFAQAVNDTDIPIKTVLGWTQLAYSPTADWSFATGYGFDDPSNGDLKGPSAPVGFLQYRKNQRYFLNVVYTIFEGFKVGAEYTHVRTDWANNSFNGGKFFGHQGMVSFFYTF